MEKFLVYACVFSMLLSGCSEGIKSEYKTYQDVVASDAIKKGRVPSTFPKNAYDIIEVSDLDTNKVWIECKFSGDLDLGEKRISTKTDITKPVKILVKYFKLDEKETIFSDQGGNWTAALDMKNKKLYYYYGDQGRYESY
ncbi:MAG: hypothetical protein A2231_00970 [Candidatus Firestonebacteria bacterium RIFOXYA2_FULL_40_8]|nr:MAG: hypothetical protein A2231_00970 [Candidatus Firestonebacteria bacterium RIFOXYA2_FULL_40_8]